MDEKITTQCTNCGALFKVRAAYIGKKVQCKKCENIFEVAEFVNPLEEADDAPSSASFFEQKSDIDNSKITQQESAKPEDVTFSDVPTRFDGQPKNKFDGLQSFTDEVTIADALKKPAASSQNQFSDALAEIPKLALKERYELIEEIGRGGMGVVLKAKERGLDRIVAIKRVLANEENSQLAVSRFIREAKALASLNHQNIVTIHQIARDEFGLYIVMEYLDRSNK